MECDDVRCIENTVIIFLFVHLQTQRIRMMQLGKNKSVALCGPVLAGMKEQYFFT